MLISRLTAIRGPRGETGRKHAEGGHDGQSMSVMSRPGPSSTQLLALVADSTRKLGRPGALGPTTADFTGKERDAETGLDYFGARYLSAPQERWTSPDWSTTPMPVPYAGLADPQTLNLYSYVRNNPLAAADPDGHGKCEKDAGGDTGKWLACKAVSSTVTSSDNAHPQLAQGLWASSDNRYTMQVDAHGGAKVGRTGIDIASETIDAAMIGGALGGIVERLLRVASARLGMEVAAEAGVFLGKAAIDEAIELTEAAGRLHHVARHLAEEGIIEAGTNAAVAAGGEAVARAVLNKPITMVMTRMATSGQAIRMFVGEYGGRYVGVAVADETAGNVVKRSIVEMIELKR